MNDGISYKWKAFILIAFSSLINVINMSSIFLLLSIIANDFNLTLKEASWSFLAQSLTVTTLVLPMGRFSDIIGRKKILILSMSFFSIGSFICYFSQIFSIFIFGRIIMGIGISMLMGVGNAILFSVFPKNENGKAIGTLTAITSFGVAIGPILSGFILEFFPWKVLFLLLSIASGFLIIGLIFILDDKKIGSFESLNQIFDWKGSILSAITIISLLLTINYPFEYRNKLILPFGIAISCTFLYLLINHLKVCKYSLIQLKYFKNEHFKLSTLTRLFGSINGNAALLLFPILLTLILEIKQSLIGIVMFISAVGSMIGAHFGGRLSDIYSRKRLIVMGIIISIITCFSFTLINNNQSIYIIIFILFVNSLSMGMWSAPNQVMTMSASHKSNYGTVGAFVFLTGNMGIVLGQCIITATMSFILMFQGFNIELSEIGKLSGSSEAFIYAWKFTYLLITIFLIFSLISTLKIRNE